MRLNGDAALNLASVQHQLDWFKAEGLVDASISIDDLVDSVLRQDHLAGHGSPGWPEWPALRPG